VKTEETASNLRDICSGFIDPGLASQRIFRDCLGALASPGSIVEIDVPMRLPKHAIRSSLAILLALLDHDTSLWISPAFDVDSIANFLRFHTGCKLERTSSNANFILCELNQIDSFSIFSSGTDEAPDQSATVVAQCVSFSSDELGWILRGPGIENERTFSVVGAPRNFLSNWALNHSFFPRGIDLFLCAGDQFVGLPRTTQIYQNGVS